MSERWDVWGSRWFSQGEYGWQREDADTDMGNLDTDELEEMLGPTFASREEWKEEGKESAALLRRWFAQDRRHRPDLTWSY